MEGGDKKELELEETVMGERPLSTPGRPLWQEQQLLLLLELWWHPLSSRGQLVLLDLELVVWQQEALLQAGCLPLVLLFSTVI